METDIFIALGSNVGEREKNLLRAVVEIAKIPGGTVTALSPFYLTEPVGMTGADTFLNAVLQMTSSLAPEDLLGELLQIESDIFQRSRSGGVDSRRMDLDLLFYGSVVIDRPPALILPHPRLHERRFVLEPLAAIAPGFMHPLLHKTVSNLLLELRDSFRVIKV